jgi:hypothetical protein
VCSSSPGSRGSSSSAGCSAGKFASFFMPLAAPDRLGSGSEECTSLAAPGQPRPVLSSPGPSGSEKHDRNRPLVRRQEHSAISDLR